MKTSDFWYDLPQELIAQHPVEPRDSSRLLVVNRDTGEMEEGVFSDILEHLSPGDGLVINDTRVRPARLFMHREGREESIEILILRPLSDGTWECLTNPGKIERPGTVLFAGGILSGEVLEILEGGSRRIRFFHEGDFDEILNELGQMPLPPYITERLEDKERYQTVYSRHLGSAAAPTAGLHFTNELLEALEKKGVEIFRITLHVGLGTFRPVSVENVEEHHMHAEFCTIDEETAKRINAIHEQGGRIFAVGTTSMRTLESFANGKGTVASGSKWTDIFITPGFEFQVVDCLITNFHLPESTLLMLVSAFSSLDIMKRAYKRAVEERFRFFSFGDAMLLERG